MLTDVVGMGIMTIGNLSKREGKTILHTQIFARQVDD